MRQLFRITGFLPFVTMLFRNAFVDLGHKIVIQNTLVQGKKGSISFLMSFLETIRAWPLIEQPAAGWRLVIRR